MEPVERTRVIAADSHAIPRALRIVPSWVVWRYETRDGKRTKVPYSPHDGKNASSTDAATWGTFKEALAFHQDNDWTDGIGIVVTDEDDFVGVDLDHCRDKATGAIEPWAQTIVDTLRSYTEITPSDEGLRVFVRGKLPPAGRKRNNVELYETGRYLTVTGRHLEGTPLTVERRADELLAVHRSIWPLEPVRGDRPRSRPRPVSLADAELLAKARLAANGAKFSRLWAGDTSEHGGDDSSADLALCDLLAFWTGGDAARMDALFRASGLYREKWDERRGAATYGELTIEKALSGVTTFYTPPGVALGRLRQNGHVPEAGMPAADETPRDDGPVASFPLTDMGNAQRLVAQFGHGLRYCHAWGKWLVWDGRRWKIDETGGVVRCAKETVRAIFEEAATCEHDEQAKALAKYALKSQAEARIKAMIGLAESEPGIPVTPDQLDASPWLLCVVNGVVDLRTGELRDHARDDLITKWAPVVYDPSATCPTWLAFLDRIMDGSEHLLTFLRRVAGYSLTGSTAERALFFLYGVGANGKSTFLETLRATLGDYAMRTPTETLLARPEGSIPNDVARLKGARFVAASEAEEGKRLAEALVKALTGGDTISARFMRGEWFDFRPEFKLWLATNHKPIIRGTDKGIWDRIRLIPFEVRIPEAEQDKSLPTKLLSELEGILAWAIRGCLEWQREGLSIPDEVKSATDAYRTEMDTLAAFLNDRCILGLDEHVSAKALYEAYKAWCEASGERPVTQRMLGTRLREREFQSRRAGANGGYVWSGLGLNDGNERQVSLGTTR